MQGLNTISWSFWIKFNSIDGSGEDTILSESTTVSGQARLLIRINAGTLEFYGRGNDGDSFTLFESSSQSFSTGVWYHIVVMYDGSGTTATIIVNDGTPDTNTIADKTFTNSAPADDVHWGTRSDGSANPLDAELDLIGFWDKVLSSQEITDLYNSGSGLDYPFSSTPDVTIVYPVNLTTYNVGDVTTLTYVTDGDDRAWYSTDRDWETKWII